jgi:hypothetical protein
MDEIGKVLPILFRKQLRRTEPHLLEILPPLWPRIAGKTMAQHSQPAGFAMGVLTLAADSTAWSTQLRHMSEQIRAEINRFLGQAIVKKLRIKTVTQANLFSSSPPAHGIAAPTPSPRVQAMATDSIADPEIAMAVASSYAKYFNRPRR